MTRLDEVPFYGVLRDPNVETSPGPILAINVGGAIIPILMSLFLIAKNDLYRKAAWGVAIVSLACYLLAEPVPGVGIAIRFSTRRSSRDRRAFPVAPVRRAARLRLRQPRHPDRRGPDESRQDTRPRRAVMSIGGAGTFDGIFVVGLIAVFLAAIVSRFNRALSPLGVRCLDERLFQLEGTPLRAPARCAERPEARIEKESLRVRPDGALALTPAPGSARLGAQHPHITTDFSEALIELITGVHAKVEACRES